MLHYLAVRTLRKIKWCSGNTLILVKRYKETDIDSRCSLATNFHHSHLNTSSTHSPHKRGFIPHQGGRQSYIFNSLTTTRSDLLPISTRTRFPQVVTKRTCKTKWRSGDAFPTREDKRFILNFDTHAFPQVAIIIKWSSGNTLPSLTI
ncbi:hypothetical protein V1477_003070 [Vespula maculifrons]|uniref:Uncharacterized protein n=1 Tax=Vespula maculifrons TaxID=7453 RepID=A0ABD2CTL4_VESMC